MNYRISLIILLFNYTNSFNIVSFGKKKIISLKNRFRAKKYNSNTPIKKSNKIYFLNKNDNNQNIINDKEIFNTNKNNTNINIINANDNNKKLIDNFEVKKDWKCIILLYSIYIIIKISKFIINKGLETKYLVKNIFDQYDKIYLYNKTKE